MAHAVSASYVRSDHMLLVAVLLAAALHVMTALGVWWVAPLHRPDIEDDAIEVTLEESKPPQKPSPPSASPQSRPAPPSSMASRDPLGLPPEPPEAKPLIEPPKLAAPLPEPKPEPPPPPQVVEPKPEPPQPSTQVAEPKSEPPRPTAKAAEPTPEPPQPATQAPESSAAPQQEAASAPPPQPPPRPAPPTPVPALEKMIPPAEAPPAPLSTRDFVKVLPPPPAPRPPPSPHPPRPAPEQLRPSPLSTVPHPRSSSNATATMFQNPAEAYSRASTRNDYATQIARRLSQYRFYPRSMNGLNAEGVAVIRVVVARNGALVSTSVAKTSGHGPIDDAIIENVQKAAPYAPLPAEIPGASASFTLTVPYRFSAVR